MSTTLPGVGGFLEHATDTTVRPRPTILVPDRGAFDFPAPYGTVGVRVTNPDDMHGADALIPRLYPYWRAINAHGDHASLLVCLGIDRQRGGYGPSLWSVDKTTGAARFEGPAVPDDHPLAWSSTEGWSWSDHEWAIIWANDARTIYRVDVRSRTVEAVCELATFPLAFEPCARYLWQPHVSSDGTTFSMTLRDDYYHDLGAAVYRAGVGWHYWPRRGAYDECQLDRGGAYLLRKDSITPGASSSDALFDQLVKGGHSWQLTDPAGAPGHSDCGFGYVVGADDYNALPGAIRVWAMDEGEPRGRLVYHTADWAGDLGYLSHCNARAGVALEAQYVVGGDATRNVSARNNEVVGFHLDGGLEVVVIAPVMTDLDAGGGTDDYDRRPKGNLDAAGEWFLWTSNAAGPRLDAYLARVPDLLTGGSSPAPPAGHWRITLPGEVIIVGQGAPPVVEVFP